MPDDVPKTLLSYLVKVTGPRAGSWEIYTHIELIEGTRLKGGDSGWPGPTATVRKVVKRASEFDRGEVEAELLVSLPRAR